ncbi:MAG: hypothetical protein PHH77_04440 [Victivallaceae bacterium]|nr:hypothetical protein [Victivallaceae bacterium]
MMKKNVWLSIGLIIVVFVSGAAAGFFAGRLTPPGHNYRPRPPARSREQMKALFERHICRRLNLTAEQLKTARPLLNNWFEEMEKLRRLHAPQYAAAFNKFYAKLLPLLSAEQKRTLDKMRFKFTRQEPPPPPHPFPDKQPNPQRSL